MCKVQQPVSHFNLYLARCLGLEKLVIIGQNDGTWNMDKYGYVKHCNLTYCTASCRRNILMWPILDNFLDLSAISGQELRCSYSTLARFFMFRFPLPPFRELF